LFKITSNSVRNFLTPQKYLPSGNRPNWFLRQKDGGARAEKRNTSRTVSAAAEKRTAIIWYLADHFIGLAVVASREWSIRCKRIRELAAKVVTQLQTLRRCMEG